MTKAYICDKCGVCLESSVLVHGIWTSSPFMAPSDECTLHLCEKCWQAFRAEYMANRLEMR